MCDREIIDIKDLPILNSITSKKLPSDVLDRFRLNLNDTLATVEKQLIERAMNETGGNKSQAAKLLGIQTSLLYYKLEKYGMIN